ncbi:MAG: hypothetical protein ACFHWZ_09930 [Phycisphaerales bacterium]
MKNDGVTVLACIACADSYGVTEDLRAGHRGETDGQTAHRDAARRLRSAHVLKSAAQPTGCAHAQRTNACVRA